jgi:DNA-binding NarL/FixJ family response regulator
MMAKAPTVARSVSCGIYAQERLLRDLLVSVLAINARVRVVAQAGTPSGWRRACAGGPPQVLVIAVPPPHAEPLAVAREFIAARPSGQVVGITWSAKGFEVPAWLAPRLVGTVARDDSLQSLWKLLDTVLGRALAPRRSSLRSRVGGAALSERESEVFRLIGDGLTTNEISERLGLSCHTVRTHRKRIAAKLGTEGNHLTRWAIVAAAGHHALDE